MKIVAPNGRYLGETTYTYDEAKPTKKCKLSLSSKRKRDAEFKDLIRNTIETSMKQFKRECNMEANDIPDPQQGESYL